MPTISDVAKQAGVSLGTVSRVINDAGNVMPDTREKVERAIKALDYVPSASAQNLRSKRTRWLTMPVCQLVQFFLRQSFASLCAGEVGIEA